MKELSVLILIFIIPYLLAFDCNILTQQIHCQQLSECTWDSNIGCTGDISLICKSPKCYFVDPLSGEDSQNGSSLAPFRTLSAAFKSLQGETGEIFIINDQPNIRAELLGYTVISSTISVRYIQSLILTFYSY